jgi:DNA transformation protein
MLCAAGITTERQLRQGGAVAAFAAVRAAGASPSLNLLWALEGALSNRDWKAVARDDRTRLLMALEDHKMDRALAAPVRRRQR